MVRDVEFRDSFRSHINLISIEKSLKFAYHRVVKRPSTPTGPRACILLVLIPTLNYHNAEHVRDWNRK